MTGKKSSAVRRFTREDIPPVASLYQRVFLPQHAGPREALLSALARYFEEVFFAGPWQDEFITSLVCVDAQDKVAGFVGVVPRRMTFKGRPIQMANSFHFMADPDSQTLAGVQLLKALLAGPQDLTFTDHGGDLGRRVWEGLGGAIALAQSFNWVRVLRPAAYANHLARAHGPALALSARLAAPACLAADWLLPRLWPGWLDVPGAALRADELSTTTLLNALEQFSTPYDLRPVYDTESLRWLLQRAARFERLGRLQQVALRDASGKLAGSYIYHLNTDGPSQVLQLAAARGAVEAVLAHLFRHAWQHGAPALTGRLDPRLMRELTRQHCRFDGAGGWTMVHASDPELLQAIYRGEAWLSRLEGEGCLLYQD